MSRLLHVATIVALFAGCASAPPVVVAPAGPTPPVAKVVPKTLTTHGHDRVDEYYWMRDDDREDPEILAYLEAENAYTSAMLDPVSGEIDKLFEEIKSRIAQDDSTVPAKDGDFYYYKRFAEGQEYALHCRKPTLDGAETVLLDENERAKGHDYYKAGAVAASPTGKLLAVAEDTLSRRIYTLRVRDIASGEFLPDVIEGVAPAAVWSAGDTHLFYVRKEEGTLREYQIWRHELGTAADKDALVFEEKDPEFSTWVSKTRTNAFVIISSDQTLSSERRVIPADAPTSEPRVFLPREENHEYGIEHDGARWLVRTNWQATNFRVMATTLDQAADKSQWAEVVPASDEAFVRGVDAFATHVVVAERRDGLPGLRILPRDGAAPYTIAFDEPVYYAEVGTNDEYDTSTLRYYYTSLTTPPSVFDYDLATKSSTLRKEDPVLGGFDKKAYVAERVWATAKDGTRVPISVVHRRDLDRSKPQPLYLYGYGSYGYSLDPWFSAARLSLLDRGFIFAVAHIRGGQELGRRWYEDGKLLHKRNTFTDFIDCAEHLVSEGYTAPDRLVASGGSAGGLLVGAVANMRPDLFAAVIAQVPFVDVVTTMLDETIPLTTFEYDEWGNPNEQPYYEYMLSYSPYDNVVAQDYPAMFVFTGLHDSQVQYWEPAKWVARLRARKTDTRQLLFDVNMDTGHGGASGRFKRYREVAKEYTWLLGQVGR